MIAGSEIGNGFASSLTEKLSPALSFAMIARRVGSERAAKVRSRAGSLHLTIWLSVGSWARDVNAPRGNNFHDAVRRNFFCR